MADLSVVAGRIEHMIETLAGPGAGEVEDLTARDLLALARDRKAAEDRAAADLLVVAARWADLHPPESIHSAATFTVPGCEHEEPIAGEGAPLVAEFCLAELGTVLGVSTTAAKKLVGHALELRHRLPRLWAQVHTGRVPAWRARSVAETTIHTTPALTREAAAFVDAQVAAVAGRVGPAQLDRLVAEAIKRYDLADVDPAADPEDGYLHVDPRHATIHDDDVHFAGTMRLEAELDIADALDLDRAPRPRRRVAEGASAPTRRWTRAGPRPSATSPAPRPRSTSTPRAAPAAEGSAPARRTRGRPPRPLRRHARRPDHGVRSDRADGGGPAPRPARPGQGLVRRLPHQGHRQAGHRPQRSDLSTPAYEVPDRIREQVILRDRTCVFPWCTRPARGCDIDHVIPHDPDAEAEGRPQPGPTQSDNLAALCRFHHRLKTHTAWRYRTTENGSFEWTSPHGHHYRRDRTGTTAVDQAEPPDRRIPRPRRR